MKETLGMGSKETRESTKVAFQTRVDRDMGPGDARGGDARGGGERQLGSSYLVGVGQSEPDD